MRYLEENSVESEVAKYLESNKKRSLLLHACCGPCLAGALSLIRDAFDVTVFFFNPNIMPKEEFIRRLQALKTVIEYFGGVKLVVPKQDESEYLPLVKGLEGEREGGARCAKCFAMRLEKTAAFADENGFDFFATTLTVSPHKNPVVINDIGRNIPVKNAVYLSSDFKKRDGYLNSVRLSKELNIYRQNYCGCRLEQILLQS